MFGGVVVSTLWKGTARPATKMITLTVGLTILFVIFSIAHRIHEEPKISFEAAQQRTPAARCGVSDIGIDGLRARPGEASDATIITGRVMNNCRDAVGVQVKVTAYNQAGDILEVDDIWPASVKNIPGRSDFPFEWIDNVEGFSRFTVRVIDVKAW